MKTKYRILYEMTLHGAEVYSSMIFEDRLYTCSKDGSIVVLIEGRLDRRNGQRFSISENFQHCSRGVWRQKIRAGKEALLRSICSSKKVMKMRRSEEKRNSRS